jgi:geranylgeranyl reductase family protein
MFIKVTTAHKQIFTRRSVPSLEKYDVVIVGAGTAGCLAAKTVAKAGLDVLLIDRKQKQDIGRKICGDAVGQHHFDKLGLTYPKGDELERVMAGVRIYSPDLQSIFDVKGEGLKGFLLNRHAFGQRLLKEALDAGTQLKDQTQALEPIIEKGYVKGITAKNQKTETTAKFYAKITIEASGFPAIIRKKLPPEMGVPTEVENQDVEACYREIRELKDPIEDPEMCHIYLSQKHCPGGYYWIFPKGDSKVNVGLGVAMINKFPNPRETLYRHVLSKPIFKDSSLIEGGAWYVPTRRPLDNMVGNGIIIVGDAACQVNPIHGGGIGPSMMGGTLAGRTVIEALEKDDVGCDGLWGYNVKYMESYGLKQAGLDVFRAFLQETDDDELNYSMRLRLITEDDLLQTSLGKEVKLTITEKSVRVFRGIRKVSFLRKLRSTVALIKKAREWYGRYPDSPGDFEEWTQKTARLFNSEA